MWFAWKVAWRFLVNGRSQTLLILLGIAIGVSVQVFLGSLIEGLQSDLIQKTVGDAPHIVVLPGEEGPQPITENPLSRLITFSGQTRGITDFWEIQEALDRDPRITAVSPTLANPAFAVRGQKTLPVTVRGVDLTRADRIYSIASRVKQGTNLLGGTGILIGTDLAEELQLEPGRSLLIRTPEGSQDRFVVDGIFDLGSKAVNQSWIVMPMQRAQAFFDIVDEISNIEIQVRDVFTATEIADEIAAQFPEVNVESWQQTNAQLLTALQSQSSSSWLIQFFVILAVTLGIASVLAVSVVQKSRQIGILKAMGTKTRRVAWVFLIQGGILGIGGSILGVLLGLGLTQSFLIFAKTEAGEPLFRVEPNPQFIAFSVLLAVAAGMIAAVLPSRRSAKLSPVEVIRNG